MNKTVKIISGILITLLILILSGVIEMEIASLIGSIPSGLGSQIAILSFSSILIFFFHQKGIINFNISKVNIKQIIYPILLTVFLLVIREFISIALGNEEHPSVDSMSKIQLFFVIVILASLSEELLFRGFLQNMLEPIKNYGINILKIKLSLPVIISGLLFGLMHFGIISMGASFNFVIQIVIFAMIMGMIAGYFQEKYNNFTHAFIVHMTANLSGLMLSIIIS